MTTAEFGSSGLLAAGIAFLILPEAAAAAYALRAHAPKLRLRGWARPFPRIVDWRHAAAARAGAAACYAANALWLTALACVSAVLLASKALTADRAMEGWLQVGGGGARARAWRYAYVEWRARRPMHMHSRVWACAFPNARRAAAQLWRGTPPTAVELDAHRSARAGFARAATARGGAALARAASGRGLGRAASPAGGGTGWVTGAGPGSAAVAPADAAAAPRRGRGRAALATLRRGPRTAAAAVRAAARALYARVAAAAAALWARAVAPWLDESRRIAELPQGYSNARFNAMVLNELLLRTVPFFVLQVPCACRWQLPSPPVAASARADHPPPRSQ